MKQILKYFINYLLKVLWLDVLKRRYFLKIDDLRFSEMSFAQFGEDRLINRLLDKRAKKLGKGLYIDIGGFHPKLFSLTYMLYLKGWRGIVIDANPETIKQFKTDRPEDTLHLAAIGERNTSGYYLEYSDPATNRLVFSDAGIKSITGLEPLRTTKVEVVSPMKFLRNLDKPIDLLTIDCEGLDLSILKSIDLLVLDPFLVFVEAHSDEEVRELTSYLKEFNYSLIGQFMFTYGFQKIT